MVCSTVTESANPFRRDDRDGYIMRENVITSQAQVVTSGNGAGMRGRPVWLVGLSTGSGTGAWRLGSGPRRPRSRTARPPAGGFDQQPALGAIQGGFAGAEDDGRSSPLRRPAPARSFLSVARR
jgi:hypothetical protein